MLVQTLQDEAKRAKTIILYDEVPGFFDSKFLLREQLIGEQRGLERPLDLVLSKRDKLIAEETKRNPDNENTIEPEQ